MGSTVTHTLVAVWTALVGIVQGLWARVPASVSQVVMKSPLHGLVGIAVLGVAAYVVVGLLGKLLSTVARLAVLVGVVAAGLGLSVQAYPAQWHQYGRAAGPLRNQEMLTDAKPDLVLAFHRNLARSRGTADMVRRARAAGVPVRVFTGKEETS